MSQAGTHDPPPELLAEVEALVVAEEVEVPVVVDEVEALVRWKEALVVADEVPPDAAAPAPLDATAPVPLDEGAVLDAVVPGPAITPWQAAAQAAARIAAEARG